MPRCRAEQRPFMLVLYDFAIYANLSTNAIHTGRRASRRIAIAIYHSQTPLLADVLISFCRHSARYHYAEVDSRRRRRVGCHKQVPINGEIY